MVNYNMRCTANFNYVIIFILYGTKYTKIIFVLYTWIFEEIKHNNNNNNNNNNNDKSQIYILIRKLEKKFVLNLTDFSYLKWSTQIYVKLTQEYIGKNSNIM